MDSERSENMSLFKVDKESENTAFLYKSTVPQYLNKQCVYIICQ